MSKITQQTVHALNNKEEQAFKEVFYSYYKIMAKHAYGFIDNYDDVEDITITAFYKLFKSSKQYTNAQHVQRALEEIIKNLCLNFLKSKAYKNRYLELNENINLAEEVDQREYNQEQIDILIGLMRFLPPQCRHILKLTLMGYNSKEISAILGITVSSVDVQKHRAIKILRKKVVENENE